MRRRDYLKEAVLNFLHFLFLPQQPNAVEMKPYEQEIKQIEVRQIHQQFTEPQQPVPLPPGEVERHTDELDVLIQKQPLSIRFKRMTMQPGQLSRHWRAWGSLPHETGETFTHSLPVVRRPYRP